uniref:Uncharacterized protein n=1 Tax=Strongyloides stercoralis TaxID=6248 RepID=A0A0K0DXW9_STRER
MHTFTKDRKEDESQFQYNISPLNSQVFRASRRSIEVSIIDENRRKKFEDKISVDMMRRLTTFDNRQLVDFVGWLNTKEHISKNTSFRTDRGNSIPEKSLLAKKNDYYYNLNNQKLNKSSQSSIDNGSGVISLIKEKVSGDNQKNSQNISFFEKKKFRASSITGGRSTYNNFAIISKKNSLQNNNILIDGVKDRRKSLANFRSKSTNRRVSDAPVRNLL